MNALVLPSNTSASITISNNASLLLIHIIMPGNGTPTRSAALLLVTLMFEQPVGYWNHNQFFTGANQAVVKRSATVFVGSWRAYACNKWLPRWTARGFTLDIHFGTSSVTTRLKNPINTRNIIKWTHSFNYRGTFTPWQILTTGLQFILRSRAALLGGYGENRDYMGAEFPSVARAI